MGQSNSHTHPTTQGGVYLGPGGGPMSLISPHHQQWAQSFPRPGRGAHRHPEPHVKVLPERLPPLKLRTTDNGAILHNGGTISGRKQTGEETLIRPRSSSAHRPPPSRLLEPVLDRSSRCGSEPDLRHHHNRDSSDSTATRDYGHHDHGNRHRISRSRKKYKAPNVPPHGVVQSGVESSSPDLPGWEGQPGDCGTPRKARLFKTRAETNRKQLPEEKSSNEGNHRMPMFPPQRPLHRSRSHEVVSTGSGFAAPDFQAELLETAQKLRPRSALLPVQPHNHPHREYSKSPDRILETSRSQSIDRTKTTTTTIIINQGKSQTLPNNNRAIETKENTNTQNNNNNSVIISNHSNYQPSKTFYFGMEESNKIRKEPVNSNVNKTNREHRLTAVERSKNMMNLKRGPSLLAQQRPNRTKNSSPGVDEVDHVERFAANYHQKNHRRNTSSCSSSFISDPDDPNIDGGIALQLRPTLPKKQLEIPRFSPTAAWRLLSTIDIVNCPDMGPMSHSNSNSQGSTVADSEVGSGLAIEERIQGPILLNHHRPSYDKSGDSGISGDTSPAEMPGQTHQTSHVSKPLIVAWTPQQDLEETSSDDLEPKMGLNTTSGGGTLVPGAKLITRGPLHAFSMSLPREERICNYSDDSKIKNSIDNNSKFESLESRDTDGNWLLSRSVPSSLTNGHNILSRSASSPSTPDQDEDKVYQNGKSSISKYSYLSQGGHLMYLPEYQARCSPDVGNVRHSSTSSPYLQLSKSCENISSEMRQLDRSPSPVRMRRQEIESNTESRGRKKKKFTFQSTVRIIENKRLAEKLSREAELKESQRLSELEAMKKVEEEFQKKRAREKANIRHQLRLFSLEEKQFSSLPPLDWAQDNLDSSADGRSEPDGAPASLQFNGKMTNHSNQAHTQVLSEFRETTRDYREYRQPRRVESPEYTVTPNVAINENGRKSTTSIVEHPPFVYDMPKNLPVYVSKPKKDVSTRTSSTSNYRKGFAHGSTVATSNHGLSDSETRPASRQNGRRSRSTTPDTPNSLEENKEKESKEGCNSNTLPRLQLSTVQPFNKSKNSYRPISFNPNKVAQPVS